MKKMSVIFFALAAVGCAVALGNPKSSESKVAVVKSGEVFKVIYQGPTESSVKITILDEDNQKVFSEKIISDGKFIRPYNFSRLTKGDYKICVEDQNGQHIEKICTAEIKSAEPGGMTAEKELMAHVIKLKNVDDKYLVSIPKQGNGDIEIHIYNEDDLLIFSEKENLDQDFAKVYVLKDLKGATIRVAQQSGEEKLLLIK